MESSTNTVPISVRKSWLAISGVLGALAVVFGAMGAHGGVAEHLQSRGAYYEAIWRTAALYHLVHSAVLLAWSLRPPTLGSNIPSWFFLLGVIGFSGSLYGLACFEAKFLGPVTPLGGLLLIAGWSAIIVSAFRSKSTNQYA